MTGPLDKTSSEEARQRRRFLNIARSNRNSVRISMWLDSKTGTTRFVLELLRMKRLIKDGRKKSGCVPSVQVAALSIILPNRHLRIIAEGHAKVPDKGGHLRKLSSARKG